uniref:Ig-like domain-containing protein n=1 Tax=Cyclopterus lumpus TaxID=8103 RepID=A0A8C2ZN40_CYCLU
PSAAGVSEPPSFKKELISLEAVRGSLAVLECEIAGSVPFEVAWKKNKKPLSADKKYRIVSQGSLTSLEIHSFESADAGEYECVISNESSSSITVKGWFSLQSSFRLLDEVWSTLVFGMFSRSKQRKELCGPDWLHETKGLPPEPSIAF